MSVQINKIIESPCDLYGPDDKLIGTIDNELSFNDIRIQIKRKQLLGYYVIWQEHKILINHDGRVSFWPNGFFNTAETQLHELF